MVEDHYRLKRLEMALLSTSFLLKTTRICYENMPKTTRLATLTYEHIFYERRLDHELLFYRDLGARWLHDVDDSRWRPSKEKNGRKRVGGFLRCAPLNICPDWKGLGMQWCQYSRDTPRPADVPRIANTIGFFHRLCHLVNLNRGDHD